MPANIGIDIAKRTYAVAVKIGEKASTGEFSNDVKGHSQMMRWIKKITKNADRLFIMEATSTYHLDLAIWLFAKGEKVAVVNPRPVHNFRKALEYENKTDLTDAQVLARYGEIKNLRLWEPPTPQIAELRDLVKRREELLGMINQEICRKKTPGFCDSRIESMERMLKNLKEEKALIEDRIDDIVKNDKEIGKAVKLLQSIFGVGPIVAFTIVAIVGDVSLFANKRAFQAFLGVNPQQFRSGSSINYSRMSKSGSAIARKQLYMAARVAATDGAIFQDYKDSLMAKGRCYKSAIAAIMRKIAGIIYAVWSTETMFSNDIYNQIKAKYEISPCI